MTADVCAYAFTPSCSSVDNISLIFMQYQNSTQSIYNGVHFHFYVLRSCVENLQYHSFTYTYSFMQFIISLTTKAVLAPKL